MNIRIQITAGQGPDECTWVVSQVAKLLETEAKKSNFPLSIVDELKGRRAGTKFSIVYKLSEPSKSEVIESWLASWIGTIQWIGTSPYRFQHPRKNWFVGVKVLKTEKTAPWNLNDISIVSFRASGPGGQNVNKVESAVRIVHNPSGIMVCAQESRSQNENKKLALERLKQKLQSEAIMENARIKTDLHQNHTCVERGAPTRIYAGPDFRRIK